MAPRASQSTIRRLIYAAQHTACPCHGCRTGQGHNAFQAIKQGSMWNQLTEAQQRIVDKNLREFTLGGVALEVTWPASMQALWTP